MKLVRALLVAVSACVVAAACGRTPFEGDESTPRNPGVVSRPPPRDPGPGIPPRADPPPMINVPPPATAPPPPPPRPRLVKDASVPVEDASRADADADTDASPDAAPSRDGSLDGAPDAVPPDCSCPTLDFFIDAAAPGMHIHLTAPYVLNIYCEETAVTLAHPTCGEVYRLSGCNGPNYAPPCLYMGVDQSRGFILGHFVGANGQPWDLLSGSITPDPPVGRAATGTFTATLTPRGGGATWPMSGTFRGCMPLFPPCRD